MRATRTASTIRTVRRGRRRRRGSGAGASPASGTRADSLDTAFALQWSVGRQPTNAAPGDTVSCDQCRSTYETEDPFPSRRAPGTPSPGENDATCRRGQLLDVLPFSAPAGD